MAARDGRVRLVGLPRRCGTSHAVRIAIAHMTGDIAIVQDPYLEYDPHGYPSLLKPILDGHADAVFGSRFAGAERRVLPFWESLGNRLLTLLGNMLNNLNLSDLETCCRAVRADILRDCSWHFLLRSNPRMQDSKESSGLQVRQPYLQAGEDRCKHLPCPDTMHKPCQTLFKAAQGMLDGAS